MSASFLVLGRRPLPYPDTKFLTKPCKNDNDKSSFQNRNTDSIISSYAVALPSFFGQDNNKPFRACSFSNTE